MRILNTLIVSIACLSAVACNRKVSDTTKVNLNLGNLVSGAHANHMVAMGSVGIGSTSPGAVVPTYPLGSDVHVIIVNVSGSGISSSQGFYQWQNSHNGVPLTPPQTISLSVPRGENRTVQVLVLKKDPTNGASTFWYGDKSGQSFTSDSADVNITVETLGGVANAGDSNISGRYLAGAGVPNPTGKISVYFTPPGKPTMLLDNSDEIFGGWFRVFGVEGATFKYITEDGVDLFGALDIANASTLNANTPKAMKVFIPKRYSIENSNPVVREKSASIYGWFGPGANGKSICYNVHGGVPTPLSWGGYVDAAGTIPLNWVPNSNLDISTELTDIMVVQVGASRGGVAVDAGAGLCTQGGDQWTDYIAFDDSKATSGDEALGFKGPFIIMPSASTGSTALDTTLAGTILTATWSYLPGTTSYGNYSAVDGVELFGRYDAAATGGGGGDQDYRNDGGVDCKGLTTLAKPFTFLGNVPVGPNVVPTHTFTLDFAGAALPATFISDFTTNFPAKTTVLACPYSMKNGKRFFNSVAISYPNSGGGGGMSNPAVKWDLKFLANSGIPSVVYNNTCVPLVIQALDASNNPQWLNNPFVNFSTTGTTGDLFYSSTDCSGAALTMPAQLMFNNNQALIYYKSLQSGSVSGASVIVQGMSLTDGSAAMNLADVPGVADTMKVQAPASVMAFQCYPVQYVTTNGASGTGAPVKMSAPINFIPEGSGTGGSQVSFYTDPNCQTMANNLHFGGTGYGETVQQIYFMYKGAPNIPFSLGVQTLSPLTTVTGNAFAAGQITGPAPASKVMINPQGMLKKNSCSVLQIATTDSAGHNSPLTGGGNESITISAINVPGQFFTSPGCSAGGNSTATVVIAADGSHYSGLTYFKPSAEVTSGGSFSATGSSPMAVSGNMPVKVGPETASGFVMVFPGQTWTPGQSFVSGTPYNMFVNQNVLIDIYAVTSSYQIDTNYISNQDLSSNDPHFFVDTGTRFISGGHLQTHFYLAQATTGLILDPGKFWMFDGLPSMLYPSIVIYPDPDKMSAVQTFAAAGSVSYSSGCQPVLLAATSTWFSTGEGYSFTAGTLVSSLGGSPFHVNTVSGSMNVYSDKTCGSQITGNVDLLNTFDSASILYVRPQSSSSVVATLPIATPSGVGSILNINGTGTATSSGSLDHYSFIGPTAIIAGSCVPYLVAPVDINEQSVASASAVTVNLSGTGGAGGFFFGTPDCTGGQISPISLAAGDRAKLVYYRTNNPIGNTSLTGTFTASDNNSVPGVVTIRAIPRP